MSPPRCQASLSGATPARGGASGRGQRAEPHWGPGPGPQQGPTQGWGRQRTAGGRQRQRRRSWANSRRLGRDRGGGKAPPWVPGHPPSTLSTLPPPIPLPHLPPLRPAQGCLCSPLPHTPSPVPSQSGSLSPTAPPHPCLGACAQASGKPPCSRSRASTDCWSSTRGIIPSMGLCVRTLLGA